VKHAHLTSRLLITGIDLLVKYVEPCTDLASKLGDACFQVRQATGYPKEWFHFGLEHFHAMRPAF
jgi:hypothetical protein